MTFSMLRWTALAAMTLSAIGSAAGTQAAPGDAHDLAQRFGMRERAGSVSLSPDGTKAAIISATQGATSAVMIANLLDGSTRTILTSSGTKGQLRGCNWATANRLVCSLYLIIPDSAGRLLGYSRSVVMDADGKNAQVLSNVTARAMYSAGSGGNVIDWTGDGKGSILMTRQFVPQQMSEATGIRDDREGLGVDVVDIGSLGRKTIERPRLDAAEYITDGRGVVRVMGTRPSNATDYMGDKLSY